MLLRLCDGRGCTGAWGFGYGAIGRDETLYVHRSVFDIR